MIDTPRTDAVMRAALDLPWGSIVEIPEGRPPSDPWQLARELEKENIILRKEILDKTVIKGDKNV